MANDQTNEVNESSQQSSPLHAEYIGSLAGSADGPQRPSPEREAELEQLLGPRPEIDGNDKSLIDDRRPADTAPQDTFDASPESREQLRERLLMERERTLNIFTNQITDSILNAGYDNRGLQTPEDLTREADRRRLIERALQMVSNLVEDRNDPTGSNNVEALLHRVNAQLRAEGSPHLLTRSNPTDRALDHKGSEFQGIRILDINSGRTVEHFDVSKNPETHEASERANVLLQNGAGFGSGIDRQALSDTLQRLHNQYGMAGVNNFLNRLYNPNLMINVMQSPSIEGTRFSGISIHPSGSPSSYHDVIWFHEGRDTPK